MGVFLGPEGRFTGKEALSGPDGRFEIGNTAGDVLTVESLTKEGYEPEPIALRSFGYNISTNINPSSNSPVVLRMWKVGLKMASVPLKKLWSIIPDGRVYTIDLLNGAKIGLGTAETGFRFSFT